MTNVGRPADTRPQGTNSCFRLPTEPGVCREVSLFLDHNRYCLVGGIASAYLLNRFKMTRPYVIDGTAVTVAIMLIFNYSLFGTHGAPEGSSTGSGTSTRSLSTTRRRAYPRRQPRKSITVNGTSKNGNPLTRIPARPTADQTAEANVIAGRSDRQVELKRQIDIITGIHRELTKQLGLRHKHRMGASLRHHQASLGKNISLLTALQTKSEPLTDADKQQLASILQARDSARRVSDAMNYCLRTYGTGNHRYRGGEVDALLATMGCQIVQTRGDGSCGYQTMEVARQLLDGERDLASLPTGYNYPVNVNTVILQQALAAESIRLAQTDELIGLESPSKPLFQHSLRQVWNQLKQDQEVEDRNVAALFDALVTAYRAVPADAPDREEQLAQINRNAETFIVSDGDGQGWKAYMTQADGCLEAVRASMCDLFESACLGKRLGALSPAVRNALERPATSYQSAENDLDRATAKQQGLSYINSDEAPIAYIDGQSMAYPPRTWKEHLQDYMRSEIYGEMKAGRRLRGVPMILRQAFDGYVVRWRAAMNQAAKNAIDDEAEIFICSEAERQGWRLYTEAQSINRDYWATDLDLYLFSRMHDVKIYVSSPPREGAQQLTWQPALVPAIYGASAMAGSRTLHFRNNGAHYDLVITTRGEGNDMAVMQTAWDARASALPPARQPSSMWQRFVDSITPLLPT